MVKRLRRRLNKYGSGIEPISVYLKVKKYRFIPIKPLTIHAIKDEFLASLLSEYALDERKKLLCEEAWRDLYYRGYRVFQKFAIEEGGW